MRDKQKTREGVLLFTGSETENLEKSCWGEDTAFPCSYQGKCARCPYSPGRGLTCNLESCPFSSSGRCKDCAHLLPLAEHRRKARCRWTGERLASGGVERVRDCIGFEERPGLDLCRSLRQGEVPQNNARRNKRLFCLPRIEKSLVSYSACLAAGGLSIGRLAHIGRVTRLGLREGPAVSHWPGSVLSCLFSFKTPKQCEVPHD